VFSVNFSVLAMNYINGQILLVKKR